MRYTCDFIEGPVTDRLISVLRDRDAKAITTMVKEKKFRLFSNTENVVSVKTLLPAHIDDYVKDTGYTVHDVFYGFGSPVETNFSENDDLVLYFLNHVEDATLERLYTYIQKMYPNSFYYIGTDFRPSQKYRQLLLRLPRGSLSSGNKAFGMPGVGHLSEATQNDFKRYIDKHLPANYTFDVNCFPEHADFIKVSLHWIWNLSVPLYCRSQIGDLIFDYYTLMQPSDQIELVRFMDYYMQEQGEDSLFFVKAGE